MAKTNNTDDTCLNPTARDQIAEWRKFDHAESNLRAICPYEVFKFITEKMSELERDILSTPIHDYKIFMDKIEIIETCAKKGTELTTDQIFVLVNDIRTQILQFQNSKL